ncbi:MAG: Zn-ribbon domain-containing OB-fold protein [Deltaproteobacteria bacterium]|nr:Zn-ribbon domain-containing OB-fold protein [Deltaproteobacteria bacterium]
MEQPLILNDRFDLPVLSTAGKTGSRFLTELRDNQRIMGLKCSQCNIVYVPPKSVCTCYDQLDEWVEVSNEGVLTACTVVNEMYSDLYQPKKAPYGLGIIKLDGADTGLCHFVNETDPSKLKVGARVKVVFKDKNQRQASILDIDHFEVTG